MKRILAVGVGVIGCSMVLMACSDNNSSGKGTASATGSSSAKVATGGKTSVKVDGSDLRAHARTSTPLLMRCCLMSFTVSLL